MTFSLNVFISNDFFVNHVVVLTLKISNFNNQHLIFTPLHVLPYLLQALYCSHTLKIPTMSFTTNILKKQQPKYSLNNNLRLHHHTFAPTQAFSHISQICLTSSIEHSTTTNLESLYFVFFSC